MDGQQFNTASVMTPELSQFAAANVAADLPAQSTDSAAPLPTPAPTPAPAAAPATHELGSVTPATGPASAAATGAKRDATGTSDANAAMAPGGKVRLTNFATIANAPLPAEGNGTFSNTVLASLVILFPAVLLRFIPFVKASYVPWWLYWVITAITGLPVTIAYWTVMSIYGPRKNEKVKLPGKPIEHYLEIKDPQLRQKYHGNNKIPMQVFHDAFFEGKIEIKGDMIDVLEYRLDWAAMHFTPELFRYVLLKMLPDVILHTARQDEEQIRDNYDRGNDFYEWFLGPQMIYTSGVVQDPTKYESLEELQNNKLSLVCSKLALKPSDKVLDIGCGWGTLTAFAAKNYGCDVTGVTLAREQTSFGNERIKKAGVSESQARILCMDYRDIPVTPGHYNKIVSLEMAEHVGLRHYGKFLRDVYNLLEDDGTFVFQVAGLRPSWQYWDLIWGLFMNKYIFPGADASASLGWVITQVEAAGFEVKNVDVLGVHYSATILRWYKNWLSNKEKIVAKYGVRWYRIWEFFLASSVIIAREGGSSLFQLTLQKNLNATHRMEGIFNHNSIKLTEAEHKNVSVY